MDLRADVIVIGAGLAGLVAAADLVDAGKKVLILDQEPESSLGGQAHWSFGGLFLVGTPEQKRVGVKDSHALALADWMDSAEFDDSDVWPRRWAEAYVDQAAGELRPWLHAQGVRFFPAIQWVERGGYPAGGPGSSVPRFHITWGTGPGLLAPFIRRVRAGQDDGRATFGFNHKVSELTSSNGRIDGCAGTIKTTGEDFTARADAVIVSAGGIGGNHDLVRRFWPEDRLGPPPDNMMQGVPDHVDGSMLMIAEKAGANITNIGRMWNYPEAIPHEAPFWTNHAVRILSGPSSLWFDATGKRLPPPLFPGFDTLRAFEHIVKTGYGHSWFITNKRIVSEEFALSGSEHNPDLTEKSFKLLLGRLKKEPIPPIQTMMKILPDFIQADSVPELVRKMNALIGEDLIDEETLGREIRLYDEQVGSGFPKDPQLAAIAAARKFRVERITRISGNSSITDPKSRPLMAVRLRILTRKSLGGLQTDLSSRVLTPTGEPLPGLYAAGEVAGFGGGGVHGKRSMEGTFLGGCLVSGRFAARDLIRELS
jgi:predicted oxidoreductase